MRPRRRVRLRRAPGGARGDARGRPRGARARRAGRLRRRRRDRRGREVEEGTAVSVWAAPLDGGEATPFHADVEAIGTAAACSPGCPTSTGAARRAPARRPVHVPDRRGAARALRGARRCCRCSAASRPRASPDAETPLFLGDEVVDGGAVGVRFDGVEILPCVSQGAAPIGPELTITAAEGTSSASSRASRRSRSCARRSRRSPPEDLRLVAGRAADGDRDRRQQARLRAGRLPRPRARGRRPGHGPGRRRHADVRPGQVVRLHARDAEQRRPRPARGARRPDGGARRPAAGRRAAVLLQRPRRGHVRPPDHDAAALDARARRRARRRLLRGRRDRPGRRRVLRARLHRHGRALRP